MSKIPSGEILDSLLKLRIRESEQVNFIGAMRLGNSKGVGTELSEVEDHAEEEHRSETPISKI